MRSRIIQPRCAAQPRRAFSLIEVIIALAILGALLGAMFTFVRNLVQSRDSVRDYTARELAATTLIDRLEADLLTCIVGDSRHGAGVRGDSAQIRILTRGVAAHLAERGAHDIDAFGDLQESTYRFAPGSREVEGRRNAMRIQSGQSDPWWSLGEVGRVRFRYHDGSDWVDSFDSMQAGRLPLAVEVAVWFRPWPGDEAEEAAGDVFEDGDSYEVRAPDPALDDPSFDDVDIPPVPDRIRVIAILDAAADDPAEGGRP